MKQVTKSNNTQRPRVRWREFEMIIFCAICGLTIIGSFIRAYTITPERETFFYERLGPSFNYTRNMLLPQLLPIAILVISYFLINRLALPMAKKGFSQKHFATSTRSILLILQILLILIIISFVLALTVNVATWFAHPHIYNYGGFQFLAFFGYNENPLTNIFFGFNRALAFIGIYCGYVTIREYVIHYLETRQPGGAYRVFLANRIVVIFSLYLLGFLCLTYFNLMHENQAFLKIFIAIVCPILVVFYGNLYWLLPWKEELSFTDTRVVVRLLIFTFICSLPFFLFLEDPQHSFIFVFFWALLLFIITPLSWMIYRQRKDKILALRGMERDLSKSRADLQFLRTQINPHFLFNTLNTLYGTALQEGSSRTAEGIQKLGDMMRFMMHENNSDLIPMEKEIEYLSNYISLQKLRVQSSPQISIEINIEESHCHHKIAPMLLIPFVENAFKHGISLRANSWIKIELNCDANEIRFNVKNSKHLQSEQDLEKDRPGIGLKNVIERLRILYPQKHQLLINDAEKEFSVVLNLQP